MFVEILINLDKMHLKNNLWNISNDFLNESRFKNLIWPSQTSLQMRIALFFRNTLWNFKIAIFLISIVDLTTLVSFNKKKLKKTNFRYPVGRHGGQKSKSDFFGNYCVRFVAHIDLINTTYLFLENVLGRKVVLSGVILSTFKELLIR
jgi:hypothetical protein